MADYRQKREDGAATASSDVDFRRGLEELFRGHLDGCMGAALASCSSARGESDEDDDGAGHDRRRRRSEVDAEDLAESSAARRRHSRILSRWVARQAEEMITTMERRNRESELMALAGLHTVSMLDSSFLRETRRSAGSVAAERRPVSASAFSILQRWRELEDEAGRRERRGMATGRVEDRAESLSRMDSIESDENEYGQWPRGTAGTLRAQREEEDDDEMNRSSREPSPDLGEVERERVRQIVRGWMTERGLTDHGAPMPSPRNDSPRAEWLGETERERVRLVREWVQMASQQRDARAIRREEREREDQHGSRASSVTDHEDGQPEHVRRDLLRLRGRQARLELITRSARERQRELQNLSEHRAVTDFAHRNRIQSFLRGRFLRNGRPSEEERAPSVAARELGQLRQRHPVSGLREGFRYRLESIVRSQASNQSEASTRNQNGSDSQQSLLNVGSETRNANNEQPQPRNDDTEFQQMAGAQTSGEGEGNTNINNLDQSVSASQERNWQEEMTENDQRDWEHTTETGLGEWNRDAGEGPDGNWQDHIDREWPQDHSGNEIESEQRTPEAHGNWHEDEMNVTAEQWQDDHSEPSRSDQPASMRRINTFIPPDDDNVYSMELRELLSRRSVSNLLSSGFRESLDQLIQSYVQRQGRDPMDWDFQQNLQNPDMPEINQDERDNTNRNQQDSVAGPARVLPVPPVPPPQPIWHRELRHSHWARNSMHRSEIEWDTINDLRADMARLQQGMSHMQRMLETCMEMQLELQRSVRQEVSAALNRNLGGKGDDAESSNGLKWSHVRKGICCVCCDTQIDSLLYRCGHMCTCSKCANELVRSGGKCPLCRAPIVEVIRAYSIL